MPINKSHQTPRCLLALSATSFYVTFLFIVDVVVKVVFFVFFVFFIFSISCCDLQSLGAADRSLLKEGRKILPPANLADAPGRRNCCWYKWQRWHEKRHDTLGEWHRVKHVSFSPLFYSFYDSLSFSFLPCKSEATQSKTKEMLKCLHPKSPSCRLKVANEKFVCPVH